MEPPSRAAAGAGPPAGEPRVQLQLPNSDGEDTAVKVDFETESVPMEWTDEKHSLYLKSMEASFINQLYDSMNLFHERFKNDNLSDGKPSQLHSNTNSPSGQFKVQRDGCWKNLSFTRLGPGQDEGDDSCGFLTSPWIQHFRPVSKISAMECGNDHEITASTGQVTDMDVIVDAAVTNLKPVHLCCSQLRHQVVGCNTEVSDQNFAYEDGEEENGRAMCRGTRNRSINSFKQ